MDDFGKESPREQHNHGSGLFIGRNNYGDIRYEMLDPKTKAMLEKLSMNAPPLANLLTEALNEGIISPDAIDSLWLVGRNINEDIAESLLLAGKNINMDVADNISRGADTLSQATDRLDYISSSLNKTVEKLNCGGGLSNLARLEGPITDAAKRIERVFTPPPPEIIVNWKTTFKACFWVFILGVAAGAGLVYYLVKR